VSQLSGSRLKWQLNNLRLGSASIVAGSGSGSSRQLAGAAATLGTIAGAADGGPGMTTVVDPPVPSGPGLGMNMGEGVRMSFLHFVRNFRSPSRKV